jgi:integrative and conjugative element protein (TIGR02256 family)
MNFSYPGFEVRPGVTQLCFADEVLTHFASQRQIEKSAPESGGQLFACFSGSQAIVCFATGPHPKAKRWRTMFRGHRKTEQVEINAAFKVGLHYIGDWHTHPEPRAMPSKRDLKNLRSLVKKSKHDLNGMVMVTVGQDELNAGMVISFDDTRQQIIGLELGG